jgi:hypothetical protein
MQSMRDFVGYELEWMKPNWLKNQYDLRLNGTTILGQMHMHGGSRAEAWVPEHNLALQRQGFWRPTLLVSELETQMPIAVLSRLGNGGALNFSDGQTQQYVWTKPHIFSAEHVWVDSAGRPVLHAQSSSWKTNVKITFEPIASQSAGLGLLVVIAGFLAVIAYQQASSAASTSTIVSAGG